ncbi:MAG TPA: hypothetical protein VJ824_14110 [Bacillota bacterium]|nr:hypothetical protein [Bacillota bacterium]
MLYLITQFDMDGLDPKAVIEHGSQLNKRLEDQGCKLLMHSEELDFSIFSVPEKIMKEIRAVCQMFEKYSNEVAYIDFSFDTFTWEDIESSGNFSADFIEAIRQAEGKGSTFSSH